ncbi:30S ribosomal protein S16 [Candidatus Omnitrophota bacterium]
MAVRIRLKRFGTKKKPHRRIVVCDKKRARDGKTIEEIGYYDPSKNPAVIVVDKERAKYWISNGATPSETVKTLLKKQNAI